jgi:hypothetical protein
MLVVVRVERERGVPFLIISVRIESKSKTAYDVSGMAHVVAVAACQI